ncbi:uncharacterized protein CDAR_595431 [Caerostris darwini]|uniref:Odorant receptor n=1 Tax=Caerostris darwini TaxID=1538125 RepID=A0AAV4SK49_9ARAC|nr:uncharacterized protein CDAR_595431 [Caerostris darwini]
MNEKDESFFLRRVSTQTCRFFNDEQWKKHFLDRTFITRMFYFVALVFPAKTQQTFIRKIFRIILEYGATLLLSMYIIGDFRNLYNLVWDLPMGLILSSLLTDVFSLTIRITLLCKRKSIFSAMLHLQDVHASLQCTQLVNLRPYLAFGVGVACILPTTLMLFTVNLCYPGYEDFLAHYTAYTFFGWSSRNKWTDCFIFVLFDNLLENQQYLLSGFLVVLTWYLLSLTKIIVGSFIEVAERENDPEALYSSYLKYTRMTAECMVVLEHALSLLLMFLYGFMVFNIFNVSTLLLTADFSYIIVPMKVTQVVLFTVMVLAFYSVSFQAVAVHEVAKKVKNAVYEMVSRSDSTNYEMKCLLLTMVTNFPSEIVVTGWKMFSLNRSFLQKTTSGMFTYAVLLSQLDRQTHQ